MSALSLSSRRAPSPTRTCAAAASLAPVPARRPHSMTTRGVSRSRLPPTALAARDLSEPSARGKSPPCPCRPPNAPPNPSPGPSDGRHITHGRTHRGWTAVRARAPRPTTLASAKAINTPGRQPPLPSHRPGASPLHRRHQPEKRREERRRKGGEGKTRRKRPVPKEPSRRTKKEEPELPRCCPGRNSHRRRRQGSHRRSASLHHTGVPLLHHLPMSSATAHTLS